jgi:hypothetical protein
MVGTVPNEAGDRDAFKMSKSNILPMQSCLHIRLDANPPALLLAPTSGHLIDMIARLEQCFTVGERILAGGNAKNYNCFALDIDRILEVDANPPIAEGWTAALDFVRSMSLTH